MTKGLARDIMSRAKLVTLCRNVKRLARDILALLTVDNAQSHVTAFRPISEAARSWSDNNR